MNDEPPKDPGLASLVGAFQGAMMPIGCMMGLVMALFWLTMIGLALMCAWIWSLPKP